MDQVPDEDSETCTIRRSDPEGGPEDDSVGFYIVSLIEYPRSTKPMYNPQAILVTDPVTKIDRRYDVYRNANKVVYRSVARYSFKYPNGEVIEVIRHDKRGLLMGQPKEPKEDALRWFEDIASHIPGIWSGDSAVGKAHFSNLWARKVLKALDTAPGSTKYWKKIQPQPPNGS